MQALYGRSTIVRKRLCKKRNCLQEGDIFLDRGPVAALDEGLLIDLEEGIIDNLRSLLTVRHIARFVSGILQIYP